MVTWILLVIILIAVLFTDSRTNNMAKELKKMHASIRSIEFMLEQQDKKAQPNSDLT